jgi:hypothetical protein
MSVEFKAATNFLRSIATAAKVMADALEQVEKDLGSKPVKKEEVPTIMPEAKVMPWAQRAEPSTTSKKCPPQEWLVKNSCLGLSYSDLVAIYNKESLLDVSCAEPTSLATEAAEYGSTATFLDGVDKEKILSGRVPIPGAGITDFSFKERQLAREMKERKLTSEPDRLLDRFLDERALNPGKTCLGVKDVVKAYHMSILAGLIVVEGETLKNPKLSDIIQVSTEVKMEILSADSEDAKRLPNGAKVVGLLRYACEFSD